MRNEIMVSVCCNAYNHEEYIEQTLQSILNQKTNFRFEILVHDDVSTDNTANIIMKYAERYPDIIKPIFENENQYRKGIHITEEIILPKAQGKYFAFCEGDDFWNDDNKLQMQVDILENNTNIRMCCHANRRINSQNGKQINVLRATIGTDGYIDHIDCLSENNFPHLTSIILKTEDYAAMPQFIREAPISDYALRAYALTLGKVYYIDRDMSSYRVMTKTSWSKAFRYDTDYRYRINKEMDDFLREYNEYTNYKYYDYICELIIRKDFATAVFTGHYAEAKESTAYATCGFAKKILINIGICFPKIALKVGFLYSHIKNKIYQ